MILIVDDKQENLIALGKTLESRGFEIDTALSGEDALKKLLRNDYELIILDVQMPGMDGFEVAEAVSGYRRTSDIPIIFLSAVNVSKEFITKGYASGGRDYLVKPFDTDILVLKIKTFVKLNNIQRSLQLEIERRIVAENKKDEFISIASHELNTPLTSIKGYIQLAGNALERKNIDQTRMFLDRSQKQVTKLNRLVGDLLDTTKIQSGKLQFNFQYFDFGTFLINAVENIQHSFPDKSLRIKAPDISNIRVFGDENRLEQVVQNYLSNAIKYGPEGKEVVIEVLLLPDGKVHVNVIDEGIGISAERQHQLFEKFYRVEENSNRFQGLGMGLYICAEIVKRHKGTYGVVSEPEKGSTFYFCIPINPAISELN
ncbi:hybrid sensor histidine kinase/response regulator [Mucilaginibacter gotjawali]|uniref:histidine kinase n=2 Tax=Mucilaginibacter gotjawali TaxID=1550579 RepID=A0A0X8X7I5_9SPHI|nr:hybrid sensor histidine kinase/response regulator [Mucilaginibacter gotjawali]MBB3058166.1 signal transduction histidine kinase [Mucilaginibacter gotjawali]BAU54879.1 Sensor histidine kinase YycG [Mucilaginibacter gotjawali]